jgi:hypothetical protein
VALCQGDDVDAGQIKAGKPGVSSGAAAVQIGWTGCRNDPSPMIAIAGRLRPVSRVRRAPRLCLDGSGRDQR